MRSLTGITILLTLGVMSDAKTTQPNAMESTEDVPVHLPCNHSTISGSEYIYWYRQIPHQGPEYMIHGLKDNVTNGMVSLTITKDRKSSTLILSRVTLRDAAVYYCIARGLYGSNTLTFGTGTRVTITPTIENPDPAVYELKSPKSSDISVCLFTDFDSQDSEKSTTDHNMIKLDSTVLNMKAMDSKSNGAVAWSNSSALECNSAFNKTFHSNSEFPCDANLVEKAFETDMNLNFHNLMVIVLRIIFLKVVGFNVLMTLRLWSS